MRLARLKDIKKIIALDRIIYPNMTTVTPKVIESQIRTFPEGQFVAESDGHIVGYCASLRVSHKRVFYPHTWAELTDKGMITTHDPNGDYLYGLEFYVHPDHRRQYIGHRFYNQRYKLCEYLHLKGIVVASRMAKLSEMIKKVKTPQKYLKLVLENKIHDPVISFQFHNGFELFGILKDYLPEDKESLGYAAELIWHNPEIPAEEHPIGGRRGHVNHKHIPSGYVRVASIQYEQRKLSSFHQFSQYVEYFVNAAGEYNSDFVVFPELFTMQLLSMPHMPKNPIKAIEEISKYVNKFKALMSRLAVHYNVNIIGGSHPTKDNSGFQNIAYIFLRDGTIHTQAKIHPTPSERNIWALCGANVLKPIMTDCGPIGVLICYDSEFPELARYLVDQGMYILFIPFSTDERRGYMRVRYCAQARAVENQCFVVMAGNVGNLPGVENMNIQYAQSCILTPSDFPFSRDGVAAETTPNVEAIALADLNIKALLTARNAGTTTSLKDRRLDLYSIQWKK